MHLTAEAVSKYKQEVYEAVLVQLKEPLQTLQHQAMLTKDERAHRVEAEKRADERVAAIEQAAHAQIAAVRVAANEQLFNLKRSAVALLNENRDLQQENATLRTERNDLNTQLLNERTVRGMYQSQALSYERRLMDIPLVEVMEQLGYGRGQTAREAQVYRNAERQVAMVIKGQQAFDGQDNLICRNALDLVCHMRRHNEGHANFTQDAALGWLRDQFGEARAAAACLVNREQAVENLFERDRLVRSLSLTRTSPNEPGGPARGGSRTGYDRPSAPDRSRSFDR
jgi:hypothetical protein